METGTDPAKNAMATNRIKILEFIVLVLVVLVVVFVFVLVVVFGFRR